jgi:hypothetical protein
MIREREYELPSVPQLIEAETVGASTVVGPNKTPFYKFYHPSLTYFIIVLIGV